VTHAVPFIAEKLPVHYLHILLAVDLKTAPKLDADGKTYTFEGAVSGYYSDPVLASLQNDRHQKSQSTHTTSIRETSPFVVRKRDKIGEITDFSFHRETTFSSM
jgi:hypothetical protein